MASINLVQDSYPFVVKDGRRESQKLSVLICLAVDVDRLSCFGSTHKINLKGDTNARALVTIFNSGRVRGKVVRECGEASTMQCAHRVAVTFLHFKSEDDNTSIV